MLLPSATTTVECPTASHQERYWLSLHNAPDSTAGFSQLHWETAEMNLTLVAINQMAPFD